MSTIETIRFRLTDDVAESDFRRRNYEVETGYMALQPGFISRESALSEDGEWFITVHWASVEEAEATMGAFFGVPQTQEFLAAIDKSTVSSARYETVVYQPA